MRVAAPGPKGIGGSGLAGDAVVRLRHHGGDDQAVYAFAREDWTTGSGSWAATLANGAFGENLTTSGLDVTGARIGERWRIGPRLLLEVTSRADPVPHLPGSARRARLGQAVHQAAAPGAYLRVIEPGEIRAGTRSRSCTGRTTR